jgi:formate dehydrogenase subunit gamma
MPPRAEGSPRLTGRFTGGQRWVHRSVAFLFGVCVATAAMLYVGPLAVIVGRRDLVATVHIAAGLALPLPLLAGWLSAAVRRDAALLNRFTPADWAWLRSPDRRSGRIPVGKFNAGQKLNAAFTVGAILVMFGTGLVMWQTGWAPLAWRTGATFVHDWLAFGFATVIIGHVWMAARHRKPE